MRHFPDPKSSSRTATSSGKTQIGVQSIETGMHILACLADCGGNLSLTDLAFATKMPAAKVHRYLVSFIRSGFIEQNAQTGYYALSGQAIRVGLVALERTEVMEVGASLMYGLTERSDLSTVLTVWGTQGPTIVRWVEGSRHIAINARVGTNLPLLRSAAGQIFGAFLPFSMIEFVLKRELAAKGAVPAGVPRTAADAKQYFAKIRNRGLGSVKGLQLPGINALSAPVFNAEHKLEAVITVMGAAGSFDDNLSGIVATDLRQTAKAFSLRLGCLHSDAASKRPSGIESKRR